MNIARCEGVRHLRLHASPIRRPKVCTRGYE